MAIDGKRNWVTVVSGKSCPSEVFPGVTFAGQPQMMVLFHTVVAVTTELLLAIGEAISRTVNTHLKSVQVDFRQGNTSYSIVCVFTVVGPRLAITSL